MAIDMSPYSLVYGKTRHLPLELEQKVMWALKKLNLDLEAAKEARKFQLNELVEWRMTAYENAKIYKEKTKLRRRLFLGKRSYFLTHVCVFFQVSSSLSGPAHL